MDWYNRAVRGTSCGIEGPQDRGVLEPVAFEAIATNFMVHEVSINFATNSTKGDLMCTGGGQGVKLHACADIGAARGHNGAAEFNPLAPEGSYTLALDNPTDRAVAVQVRAECHQAVK
eukprot:1161563-Pelagomonas_calceolata.AAC.3